MNLTAVTETLARPGLLGLHGRRAEKRMQQALKAYFTLLARKVTGLNLAEIVNHSGDVVAHSVELRLHNTLRILSPMLRAALSAGIQDAMLTTNKIHHFAEAEGDDSGDDFTVDSITSEEAAVYAEQQAAQLVTGINDTTQSLIADAVSKGIEDQLGVPGTASLIRDTLDSMTTYRSRMIASTEMNDAMSEAMIRKLGRIGIQYKRWITAGACCDACADNEDDGPIPIEDEFSSGDDRPPAHPNCRCAVVGARAPEAA